MCFRIFIQAFVLFGLFFPQMQVSAQKSVGLKSVVDTAKSSHAIALEYLEGQLNAEKQVLSRLQKLRAQEHASWFELSQQQRKVNELTIYAVCLNEFQKRVLEIEQLKAVSQTLGDDSVISRVLLKLHSPDSVRLLGWVLVPAETVDRIQVGLDGKALSKADDSGIFLNALRLAESPEWMQSTIEVLEHELQANGPLRESQLKRAYLENSLPQIEALCDAQLLPESMLQSLEARIKQTNQFITQETQRRQRLRRALDDLADRLTGKKTFSSPKASGSKDWPKEVVSESALLDHLLALYQQQLILKAQEKVAILDLEFWRQAVQRLPKNETVGWSGNDGSTNHSRLANGSEWERKKYEHKMDLLKARIDSLRHEQIVFDLEERRFLSVCDLLVAIPDYRSVSTSTEATIPSFKLRSMGFLEMNWPAETWPQLQISRGQTDFLSAFKHGLFGTLENNHQHRHNGNGDLRLAPEQFNPSAERSISFDIPKANPRLSSTGPHPSKIQQSIANIPLRNDETPKTPERFYEYGELKARYRSQAPVGQIPWYLPGSPGNFGGYR